MISNVILIDVFQFSYNMTAWKLCRIVLLMDLIMTSATSYPPGDCEVCPKPLVQNSRVPWVNRLGNSTKLLFIPNGIIRVLRDLSFVSAPNVEVSNASHRYEA